MTIPRVLRINPVGNDPRHRRRELALVAAGCELGMVVPDRPYIAEWGRDLVEPTIASWTSRLWNAKSIPLHLWSERTIRQAVREFRPDVVDVHEEPYFPSAAQVARSVGDVPVVFHTDQNLPRRYPRPVVAMRSWVFRRASALYSSSTEGADVLRGWGYRGPIDVVPYGVDDELFVARPTGDRVGFVGRLVESKGVLDLLSLGPRLLCVGSGPLAPAVRAAGGEVRTAHGVSELVAAFEEMAVLVVPSRTTPRWKEQFGRSAAEGMAAGLPVAAYASGSLPEVIGDAGVLVPEGDARALLGAVEAVLADPGELGDRARSRARSRFAWPVVAGQMIDLYERVA